MKIYIAHTKEGTGETQTIKEHSENTAKFCKEFSIPELKDLMYVMGLTHDGGKYQIDFQRRISGENIKVEHANVGAHIVKEKYCGPVALLMEYCIMGHHTGIPDGGSKNDSADMPTLAGRLQKKTQDYSAYQEEIVVPGLPEDAIIKFLVKDCEKDREMRIDKFAFLTRYSFSCLTDADSLDTMRFCNGGLSRPLTADFSACLQKINCYLEKFEGLDGTLLQKTRTVLQKQVFEKCSMDAEVYLMNMPTGSGKTLCSAKFALERAVEKEKKRIIYVIPYNSIIDQTVHEFEVLFGESAEILRHQSTFSYEDKEDIPEDFKKVAKDASENWNVSSIIVTTAVQFFESLYANKRGRLRKLHNMADAVIIFDEAHLMPMEYLQPYLRGISYIVRYLNSEAVFLTATMPDFHRLLTQYTFSDLKIVDLVEDRTDFSVFRKCRYAYLGEVSDDVLLTKCMDSPSNLLIMNRKETARELYKKCTGTKFYLSTYLTGVDRERIIREIKAALQELEQDFPSGRAVPADRRVTILATSLIEVGVDLDVYTVYRELAGLDNILQSGGRCNREGKRDNAVTYVFKREGEGYKGIKENKTEGILERYHDISEAEAVQEYYDALYFINQDTIQSNMITNDCTSFDNIPFRSYAEKFHIIDSQNMSIVVGEDDCSKEAIEALKKGGAKAEIARKLQKYTCTVSRTQFDDLYRQHAVDDFGTGIWCLTNLDYYDKELGITFEAKDYFL